MGAEVKTRNWRRFARPVHPNLPWPLFVKRLGYEIDKDNVFGRAAELAYFFLFSVFPLLLVLTNLLGMIASGRRIEQDLLRYFGSVMPPAAYQLVASTLDQITKSSSGGKLSLGILMALAASSSGMVAIIEGLNTAYGVREARRWWKRRVVAIVLTVAMAAFTIVALGIMLYGSTFGDFIAAQIGARTAFQSTWRIVQWPLMLAFVLVAFAIVYRFAPNVNDQKWHWILPGAGVALLLWLLASLGLRLYLHFFDTYDSTYGSLGALIVLMIWFYLFGAAILVGGKVNSIIEQAAARAGDPEAKLPGEKAPGEKK
jgi:membrane protein